MDDPRETLKSHLTAVIEGLRYLDVDSVRPRPRERR